MILRKFNCFCWRHPRAVTEKPLRGQTPTQDAKQTRWGYLIMMTIHARLGRTAAALAVVGGMTFAAATESHASLIYATEVDWFNNGTVGSSNDRDNPANSLGAPDDDFLSLGLSSDDNPGFAVFGFGQDFIEEGRIWEITFNCDPTCVDLETATIYVGTSDQYTMGQASRADQIALVTGMGGFFGSGPKSPMYRTRMPSFPTAAPPSLLKVPSPGWLSSTPRPIAVAAPTASTSTQSALRPYPCRLRLGSC